MDKPFMEAAGALPERLRIRLSSLPDELQSLSREICLRSERPLLVSTLRGDYFALHSGGFARLSAAGGQPYLLSREELRECVRVLTGYSLHSCQQDINGGFLTLRGGHRAGVVGSCTYENGRILHVGDISSVNLRIARQVKGTAEALVRRIYPEGVCSTLIAGPPSSGKTTLLKDIVRCLSGGRAGYFVKLSLIDERGELAAVRQGAPQNDVGWMTDVLDGYRKGDGMAIAIRSMSPQAVVLDEIAGEEDAASIRQSLNAGVAVIATVHAGSLDELCRKRHIRALLQEGAFRRVVMLRGADMPCAVGQIASPGELGLC